jgi:3-oxoadipyl-CoA thiolase
MGFGPTPAVQKLLLQTKLSISDFDVIELNEAFAAQALAVLRALGLPDDGPHINPNGGAIALGHPVGASGARIVLHLLTHLAHTGNQRGMASICIGGGQGGAMYVERITEVTES